MLIAQQDAKWLVHQLIYQSLIAFVALADDYPVLVGLSILTE
jgi:hypothetical protein